MSQSATLPNPAIARLAAMLRTMPLCDAREFMGSLLPVMQDTHEVQPLRAAFIALNQCDQQLELIAEKQARLNL